VQTVLWTHEGSLPAAGKDLIRVEASGRRTAEAGEAQLKTRSLEFLVFVLGNVFEADG
jgi:hypothetical protein